MKGITITELLKEQNELLRDKASGYVYMTTVLPNKFWSTVRIIGGYRDRTDLHEVDGWYDVVTPTITDTEKLGDPYFDDVNGVFTYYILNKTPEELAAYQEEQLNKDLAQQVIDRRRADGVDGFNKVKAIIERKFRTGEATAAQALSADKYFHSFIKDLNFGSWHIVQAKLVEEEPNVIAAYQTLFNQIKTKVDNYIQNDF